MGYPQPAYPGQPMPSSPTSQESVASVLTQALAQFNDVEVRINQLRDRIEPRHDLGKAAQADPSPPGVMAQASLLRNASVRLQGLCSELEAIL